MNFETEVAFVTDNENTNISSTEIKDRSRKSNKEKSSKSFKCEWCNKSYLSSQALNLHNKTKHAKYIDEASTKRGKGKLDGQNDEELNVLSTNGVPNTYEEAQLTDSGMFGNYFDMGKDGEKTSPEEIDDIVRELDNYFASLNTDKGPHTKGSLINHPIVENLRGVSGRSFFQFGSLIINDVFAEFLEEMARGCSRDQFYKVLKLTLLFADCIERKFEYKTTDYCGNFGPLEVPTLANNFIVDYMKKEKAHFDCNRTETIGFVFKICYWLYCKDYTDITLRRIQEGEREGN